MIYAVSIKGSEHFRYIFAQTEKQALRNAQTLFHVGREMLEVWTFVPLLAERSRAEEHIELAQQLPA